MPRTIDVYLSLISPWAHLGHAPYLALAAKHGVKTVWKPVSLGPLFSETGGLPLAKRAIQRRRYRDVELARWAERRGRPVKFRPAHWPYDPALADRAALALIAAGADPTDYLAAGFRAVWEEDRDLGSRAVIAEALTSARFDAEATLIRAEAPETEAAYRANYDAAVEADVFGSPSYVLDGEVFWGQDRLDLLDEALSSGRPPYRALG